MQLTNVPPAPTMLRLARNQPFSLGLQLNLSDNTAANLTDHVLSFEMAEQSYAGGVAVVSETFTLDDDPTTGFARLNLQGTDLDVAAGTYDFTISVLTDEEYSAVIVIGQVEVVANTSTAPVTPYAGEGVSNSITLTLQQNNLLTVTVGSMLYPMLQIGTVSTVDYWEEASATIWGSYPLQFLDLVIPASGGPLTTLARVPPGTIINVRWDGFGDFWSYNGVEITSRPTDREDVTILFTDATDTVGVPPAWALSVDIFMDLTT